MLITGSFRTEAARVGAIIAKLLRGREQLGVVHGRAGALRYPGN